MATKKSKKRLLLTFLVLLALVVGAHYALTIVYSSNINYVSSSSSSSDKVANNNLLSSKSVALNNTTDIVNPDTPATHLATPNQVKAVYMTNWVAGVAKLRDPLIKLVDDTELNSVVIDIKDSTGRIGYEGSDPEITKYGSYQNRISNIRALTSMLHSKNIYVIGRIAVFQDPYMSKLKPEWAITKKSDGKVWENSKGLSFLDPANKDVWNYIISIAKDAYAQGFDEINFDYIRYPSDGNISDINYHLVDGATRADNIESFFKYLSQQLKTNRNNITTSADIFGMTTQASDDMGIGQVWEKALPYFDFISPMVYPSHYSAGIDGYQNPAEYPYQVIYKALSSAIIRTNAVPGQSISKIRPWLQDFNLGAVYNKDMVDDEIKAVSDNGLTSWLLWDPSNKYTPDALKLENNQ